MAERMGLSNHNMSFSKSTDDLPRSPVSANKSSVSMAFQRITKDVQSCKPYINASEQTARETVKPLVDNEKPRRMANITLTQPTPFRVTDSRSRMQHCQSMGNLYQATSTLTLSKVSPSATKTATMSTQTENNHQQTVTSQTVATQTNRLFTECEIRTPKRSDAIPLGSADKSLAEMKLEEMLSELKRSDLTKPLSDNCSPFTLQGGSPIKINNPRRYLTIAYNQTAKSFISDFIRRSSEEQVHIDSLNIRFQQLLHDTLTTQRLDEAYKTKDLAELTQLPNSSDAQSKIESILANGELRSLLTLMYMALQLCVQERGSQEPDYLPLF
ncbi:hypothetical protein [Endozoicomonas elysicola]|uniref:Uncharacterized protein n=1 Tax=Endozoicomonas elysicola TaxID=305900 RepID=A0A081K947_9GAMM|nr:hypothetical protein [Endozoicomonas elysicola]KEI70673.1 hypothetical protein GV64_07920 [Endozoicomonas elysicola]